MRFSVVVCALVVCVAFAGRVCAQTYTPGELAATRVVADAQARADALRRRIDAPTVTPLPPTATPTETATATAATSTPLPPMPTVMTVIVIQQVQPTTAAASLVPTGIPQTAATVPTQRDNSISAKLERSIPFAVFIVLVLVLGRLGMIYAQRRGL